MLAAQAVGADLAYVGSPFIATEEANAADAYKQAIVESGAADIVYSDLFTGVHGNYLRSSILNAGLDPDNLAAGNLDTMKFGSEGSAKSKAWRDIWGSGQGIGAVDRVRPAAGYIDLIAEQYAAARARLLLLAAAMRRQVRVPTGPSAPAPGSAALRRRARRHQAA